MIKTNNIVFVTTILHEEVSALYEALMDEEYKEAIDIMDSMRESIKSIKLSLPKHEV